MRFKETTMKYNKRYVLLVPIFCLFAVLAFHHSCSGMESACIQSDCSSSTDCCEFLSCAFFDFCIFENNCVDENGFDDCGRNTLVCCDFEDCAGDFDCVCVVENGFQDCGVDPELCCADQRCSGEPICIAALFRISVDVRTLNISNEFIAISLLGSGMYTDNQSLTRQTEDIGQAIELRPGQTGTITLTDVTVGDVFRFGASFRSQLIDSADCEFTREFIDNRDPEVIWDGRFLTCNVW